MTISTTEQGPSSSIHTCKAKLLSKTLVGTGNGTKMTYLIKLGLESDSFPFEPGDSISFTPENHPSSIEIALKAFSLAEQDLLFIPRKELRVSAKEYFAKYANLSKPSKLLVEAAESRGFKYPDTDALHILENCQFKDLDRDKVTSLFLPLSPRFYSIASAKSWKSDEIDLLISETSYEIMGKMRHGVASHFLCQRAAENAVIEIKLHPARQFRLPEPSAPIIMIGPGTGIAPFRAFIQERISQNANGPLWLFFGERYRSSDYFFSDFWEDAKKGIPLRVDCAFSRDQEEKIYVQHLLLANRKELWKWIENGARIYICGDAKKMAREVEETLKQIAIEETLIEPALSAEEFGQNWIRNLRKEKRLLLDVY